MTLQTASHRTPIGDLTLLARDDVLVSCGFGTAQEMAERLGESQVEYVDRLGTLSSKIEAYLAGDVTAIDDIPVEQPGGAFRQAAWKVMRDVPAGETISYAELAARAGSPNAVRAAGSACARNHIAVVVPCHRILRSGGNLGGYYFGLPVKQWLLEHERGR